MLIQNELTQLSMEDSLRQPLWDAIFYDGEYYFISAIYFDGIASLIKEICRDPNGKPRAFFVPKGTYPELQKGSWKVRKEVFDDEETKIKFHVALRNAYHESKSKLRIPFPAYWKYSAFNHEIHQARVAIDPYFSTRILKFSIYRLRGDSIAVEYDYHPAVIELFRQHKGQFQKDAQTGWCAWRLDGVEPAALQFTLRQMLRVSFDNIVIHEGLYQFVGTDSRMTPSGIQQVPDRAFDIEQQALTDGSLINLKSIPNQQPDIFQEPEGFIDNEFMLDVEHQIASKYPNKKDQSIYLENILSRAISGGQRNAVLSVISRQLRSEPVTYDPTDLNEFLKDKAALDFQLDGIKHLISRTSCLLADEMGTGKTVQASLAFGYLMRATNHGTPTKKTLISCPKGLLNSWRKHIKRYFPDDVIGFQKYSEDASWVLMNYDIIDRITDEQAKDFTYLLVDEAHNQKNKSTKSTQNLARIADAISHKCLISATPIINRISDIHTLLQLSGHPLGNMSQQRFVSIFNADQRSLRVLNTLIEDDWMLRRLKTEVLSLPEKKTLTEWLSFPAKLSKEYRKLETEGSMTSMSRIHKLRQYVEVAKLPEVIRRIKASGDDDRFLIFINYKPTMDAYKAAFKKHNITGVFINGDSSLKERSDAEDTFQSETVKSFVGTYDTAGEGLTLTAANETISAGLPWHPSALNQAQDRIHRYGQTRPVKCTNLVFEDSIERDIHDIIFNKALLSAMVVDGGGQISGDDEHLEKMIKAELLKRYSTPS